ncbi:hypothetical protein GOV03_00490 [Candidatus Woesearchaeota archaeon]|nr:hypothetical protein [Candidatus Woesearchaeota archaeon]
MKSTLENIAQKTSFIQRIRNSLTNKLALVLTAGSFAFAGCGTEDQNCTPHAATYCQEGIVYWADSCGNIEKFKEQCDDDCNQIHDGCKESSPELPTITTKTVNGILLNSGITNSEGKIQFLEGNENVDLNIINENNQPVENAQVMYFNGSNFECFQIDHNNYAPHLECFAHNSSHTLSLTSSPLQVLNHNSQDNQQSQTAATNYASWTEANWDYLGCRDKPQLESMMDGGSYLVKALSKIFTLGFADVAVDAAYDHMKDNIGNDDVSHVYFFNPSAHGFYGTSTIWTMEFKKKEAEDCSDQIDNDCDGFVDFEDGDCTCSDECSPEQKECFGDGWKECGDYDSDNCLDWGSLIDCGTNETCENASCVDVSCSQDNDCDLGYICRRSTNECLAEPDPLCYGDACLDVIIHIFDSGPRDDDSFGLEIASVFYGETPSGGEKTWTVSLDPNRAYLMTAYGIGIPDGIGTYTIELTNAGVLSGPPLTGDDLDAGMFLEWHIKAGLICNEGEQFCADADNLQSCNNNSWELQDCDSLCQTEGHPAGADYCSQDSCVCDITPCDQAFYECNGMDLTYCKLAEGILLSLPCETLCQDGGYTGASDCRHSDTYAHDVCFCYD